MPAAREPERCFVAVLIPGGWIAALVVENKAGWTKILNAPSWRQGDKTGATDFVRKMNDAYGISAGRAHLIIDSARNPLDPHVHAIRRRTWDRTEAHLVAMVEQQKLRARELS